MNLICKLRGHDFEMAPLITVNYICVSKVCSRCHVRFEASPRIRHYDVNSLSQINEMCIRENDRLADERAIARRHLLDSFRLFEVFEAAAFIIWFASRVAASIVVWMTSPNSPVPMLGVALSVMFLSLWLFILKRHLDFIAGKYVFIPKDPIATVSADEFYATVDTRPGVFTSIRRWFTCHVRPKIGL